MPGESSVRVGAGRFWAPAGIDHSARTKRSTRRIVIGCFDVRRVRVVRRTRQRRLLNRGARRARRTSFQRKEISAVSAVSAVTDLDFSISTGLATSTVTPGSTAPDVSFTVPPIALCARATAGAITHSRTAMRQRRTLPLDINISLNLQLGLVAEAESTSAIVVRGENAPRGKSGANERSPRGERDN